MVQQTMPSAKQSTETIDTRRGELTAVFLKAEDESGATLVLSSGSACVGTAADCELRMSDKSVSRRHLLVELLPGSVRVKDLGSRNGTFFLNARVETALIPVGGALKLGRAGLRILPAEQAAAPESSKDNLPGLIGVSRASKQLFATLERLAVSNVTVLLRGESGVGKEVCARAIHSLSARASKPFVVFDCASASPQLIDTELFGHAKGAFTGADRARAGVVDQALDGTLLLDEVGALPLELQPRLLRLLEQHEFKRVGEGGVRKAGCRVMATTQRDLASLVREGKFRDDLRYRLEVATVTIPPLRERPEDIPVLALHFARTLSGVPVELQDATLAVMQCDPWPGNVRELRNAVERALTLEHFGDAAAPRKASEVEGYLELRDRFFRQFERDFLRSLIARHGGNLSAAARGAGLARSQLYRLLERHGLAKP